jgi:glycosyltransferase involved in cell wall biosynthesis
MVIPANPKYVIVTPVRDEALYVEQTIASVARQTLLPREWVIVDDGSTDGTAEILDRYRASFEWIKVIHRKNRGHRASGGGVVEAFYDGYSELNEKHWDYIVKLDGDLSFEPDYFEKCLKYFTAEHKLGIAGGTVCVVQNGLIKIDSEGDPPFHVRGATKIYRRSCWEQIAPLVKAPGWDTIDEFKANMNGWTTKTFSEILIIQHKPTGGADGAWKNWFKNGLANYIAGYHPVFMIAKCFKRALRRPMLIASAALFAGFISGYLRNIMRLNDHTVISYLRKQQIKRIFLQPSIYR